MPSHIETGELVAVTGYQKDFLKTERAKRDDMTFNAENKNSTAADGSQADG